MPITFRCSVCGRTLSIAKRKAGTQVACPQCGKMISVPATAGMAVETDPFAAHKLEAMPLFERTDFESLLSPAVKAAEPRSTPASTLTPSALPLVPKPIETEDSVEADVMGIDGVVVTRQRMIVVGIVVTVLLAVSFTVGYFLAAATVGKPRDAVTSQRGSDG